jgi:DNA-binding beta-propeller fold protein YncE
MGPEVHDTFLTFQQNAKNAGIDVAGYGVPYTTITLVELLKQTKKSFPNVQEGVRLLSDHLQSQATSCPKQRETLVGYSEGAWIIDKLLHDASSDLTGRVTAVVLYGDPEFDHTAGDFVALSTDGDGLARSVVPKFAISPYLPQGLSGRAVSYCLSETVGTIHPRLAHDPICNWTSSSKPTDVTNCIGKNPPNCVHLHYRNGVTQKGADFLAGVLLPTAGKKIYVSNSAGIVEVFTSIDNLTLEIDKLDTGTGSYETGMAFDNNGNLYVTDFGNNSVTQFILAHNPGTTFASGLPSSPESIVFDGSGNAYVGSADAAAITKLDPGGSVIDTYSPVTEDRGADWIDLAKDGCTMAYTSEGTTVQQFDVCTKTQLAPLATDLPGTAAYEIRLLPGGGALVADSQTIVRLDANGKVVANYDAPGDDEWFAVALDPQDPTSFWAGDLSTGDVYQFDILTGSEVTHFNAGPGTVEGLVVR